MPALSERSRGMSLDGSRGLPWSLQSSRLRHHLSRLTLQCRVAQLLPMLGAMHALSGLRELDCNLRTWNAPLASLEQAHAQLHFPPQLRSLALAVDCPPEHHALADLALERLAALAKLTSLRLTLDCCSSFKLPGVRSVAFLPAMQRLERLEEQGLFAEGEAEFAAQAVVVRQLRLRELRMTHRSAESWPARLLPLLQEPGALNTRLELLLFKPNEWLHVWRDSNMHALLPLAATLTALSVQHSSCMELLPRFSALRTLQLHFWPNTPEDCSPATIVPALQPLRALEHLHVRLFQPLQLHEKLLALLGAQAHPCLTALSLYCTGVVDDLRALRHLRVRALRLHLMQDAKLAAPLQSLLADCAALRSLEVRLFGGATLRTAPELESLRLQACALPHLTCIDIACAGC